MFVIGAQLGRYVLERKLGEGGFGVVYTARDTSLERLVALKFLLPQHTADAQMLGRFLREARSAAKIAHSGIVTVYDCGQLAGTGTAADGTAYIAMELLAGESLGARIARGPLPPSLVRDIARQIASALGAAHAAGIVHRDLKPDNIFLARDAAAPGGERVKILDFGIAKLASSSIPTSEKTHALMIFGTPVYMSPEQCRSSTNIDARSDIYSLGCIVFEMLAGRPPFLGETGAAGELMGLHQHVRAPSLHEVGVIVPAEVEALVATMLAKSPDERPASMELVASALGAPAGDPHARSTVIASPANNIARSTPTTLSASSGAVAVPPPSPRRWGYPVAAVAIVAVAVLGILAVRRGSEDAASRGEGIASGSDTTARSSAATSTAPVDAAIDVASIVTNEATRMTATDAATDAAVAAAIGAPPASTTPAPGDAHRPRRKTPLDAGAALEVRTPPDAAPAAKPPAAIDAAPAETHEREPGCATDDPECLFGKRRGRQP